ncbi:hypothetical protein ACFL6Y_06615 [Elusimicrobiota bacterium]
MRGGEPSRIDRVPGFSESDENDLKAELFSGRFKGESKFRFRSDKPDAQTFNSRTPAYFINPLYLYNRTSLLLELDKNQEFRLDIIALRRNKTSAGASEPPISMDTLKERYFLKHWSMSAKYNALRMIGGDFTLGWGEGLLFARDPSNSYRPFLMRRHSSDFKPNRSGYGNNGFSGMGIKVFGRQTDLLIALTRTRLDGRVSAGGDFIEDLRHLSESQTGEISTEADIIRRGALEEKGIISRIERNFNSLSVGLGGGIFKLNRPVIPQPKIYINDKPNRWAWAFEGDSWVLLGCDAALDLNGGNVIVSEIGISMWGKRAVPAVITGIKRKKTGRESGIGLFYIDPFFFSRLSDPVREGSGFRSNRKGFFLYNRRRFKPHDLSFQGYAQKNILSEFSGSALSHKSHVARLSSWMRLDDKWKIFPRWAFYWRAQVEQSPYLIDARDPSGRIVNIRDLRARLELKWQRRRKNIAAGYDSARVRSAQNQGTSGKLFYIKGRFSAMERIDFYGKITLFDLGKPIFKYRYLYMSNSEMYWRRLHMSSIAYQSLFASYAPKGTRFCVAIENAIDKRLVLWMKFGFTALSGDGIKSVPRYVSERDKIIGLNRFDFKTELVLKW